MTRAEMRLRVFEALFARVQPGDGRVYLDEIIDLAKKTVDDLDPPRKPPTPPDTRDAKGRFTSHHDADDLVFSTDDARAAYEAEAAHVAENPMQHDPKPQIATFTMTLQSGSFHDVVGP